MGSVRLDREGLAGAFVVVIGALLWLIVRDYPRGDLSEIGPGYMPWAASIGMVGLGVAMVARSIHRSHADALPAVGRAAVIVPFGMALFAYGLQPLGLFMTSALGVFVVTFAESRSRLIERFVLALALAAFVTLVFGYGLGMSLPLWPFFLRP